MNLKPSKGSGAAGFLPPGNQERMERSAGGGLGKRAIGCSGIRVLRKMRSKFVQVWNERFDVLAGRAFVIAKVERDGWLDVFDKNIGCAIRVIVHLGANAQEKIVRGFQLLAFAVADEIVLLQIFQRARPIFEES